MNLEELHRRAYQSLDREDNFNLGEFEQPEPEEDNIDVWAPVARDPEFEKHIEKLKRMKAFNLKGGRE